MGQLLIKANLQAVVRIVPAKMIVVKILVGLVGLEPVMLLEMALSPQVATTKIMMYQFPHDIQEHASPKTPLKTAPVSIVGQRQILIRVQSLVQPVVSQSLSQHKH
jgi:hypothetical protein